jgi:hypothetical protein
MTSEVGPRRVTEHFYLVGEVEWLPVEQGGRERTTAAAGSGLHLDGTPAPEGDRCLVRAPRLGRIRAIIRTRALVGRREPGPSVGQGR